MDSEPSWLPAPEDEGGPRPLVRTMYRRPTGVVAAVVLAGCTSLPIADN